MNHIQYIAWIPALIVGVYLICFIRKETKNVN